jgi:hypothetical protein
VNLLRTHRTARTAACTARSSVTLGMEYALLQFYPYIPPGRLALSRQHLLNCATRQADVAYSSAGCSAGNPADAGDFAFQWVASPMGVYVCVGGGG